MYVPVHHVPSTYDAAEVLKFIPWGGGSDAAIFLFLLTWPPLVPRYCSSTSSEATVSSAPPNNQQVLTPGLADLGPGDRLEV